MEFKKTFLNIHTLTKIYQSNKMILCFVGSFNRWSLILNWHNLEQYRLWVQLIPWQTGSSEQKSSSSFFPYRRPLWAALAWAGMSNLKCCPSSISSADHGAFLPPTTALPILHERWFWWDCCGIRHDRAMQSTVAKRGSCGPTRKLVLFRTQLLFLCSQ